MLDKQVTKFFNIPWRTCITKPGPSLGIFLKHISDVKKKKMLQFLTSTLLLPENHDRLCVVISCLSRSLLPCVFPISRCFLFKCPFSARGLLSVFFISPLNLWTGPSVHASWRLMVWPGGGHIYLRQVLPRPLQSACWALFHSSVWTPVASQPEQMLRGIDYHIDRHGCLDRAYGIDWCSLRNPAIDWTPVFA